MKDFGGYAIKISLHGESDWVAELINLPQVNAFGGSPEDALVELHEVWRGYVLSCKMRGDAIPANDSGKEE
jgi:predicted RNase H-like HicB family nuclease